MSWCAAGELQSVSKLQSLVFHVVYWTKKGYFVIGVYYRLLDQGEAVDKAVFFSATRIVVLTGSRLDGEFQPPGCPLGVQHSRL